MDYDSEERRKIILENYNNPTKQIDWEKLNIFSREKNIPILSSRSSERNCGDTFHLVLKKRGDILEEIFFSADDSCLITISFANILCSYLEKLTICESKEIIKNCFGMIEGKNYSLEMYPKLNVFGDILKYPHRIECLGIVIKTINRFLEN